MARQFSTDLETATIRAVFTEAVADLDFSRNRPFTCPFDNSHREGTCQRCESMRANDAAIEARWFDALANAKTAA